MFLLSFTKTSFFVVKPTASVQGRNGNGEETAVRCDTSRLMNITNLLFRRAQDRLLWKDKACPATHLAHHWLESYIFIVTVMFIIRCLLFIIYLVIE